MIDRGEYARLLGYPPGTILDGLASERAEAAIEWYERNGSPSSTVLILDAEAIAAITAGVEVDEEAARLWERDRVDEAYFLDRLAAAVVEDLAQALGDGLGGGPKRSPGTGGVPFEDQWRLFSLVAPLEPGIEMLPSGMLRPKSSLLAVYRLDEEPREGSVCRRCGLRGCTFRRSL